MMYRCNMKSQQFHWQMLTVIPKYFFQSVRAETVQSTTLSAQLLLLHAHPAVEETPTALTPTERSPWTNHQQCHYDQSLGGVPRGVILEHKTWCDPGGLHALISRKLPTLTALLCPCSFSEAWLQWSTLHTGRCLCPQTHVHTQRDLPQYVCI